MLCIKNGLIYTMTQKEPIKGDVLIEDGKIRGIGADLEIPEGTEVIDAEGWRCIRGLWRHTATPVWTVTESVMREGITVNSTIW